MAAFVKLSKSYAIATLRWGLTFINNHPKPKRFMLEIARRLGLHTTARALFTRVVTDSSRLDTRSSYDFIPTEITHLSPRAQQIYFDLKAAIKHQQTEKE